jgi:Asp-tRNA(Asn)/Glu-tRNA(Gln) amidotransferase A subunit family amidase
MSPIGLSVNDVKIMTEVLFKAYVHDTKLPPLPFDNEAYNSLTGIKASKRLRIGYFDTLPLFESSVSTKRAIKIAKEKLEALGHTLVPFKISLEENLALKKALT